MTRGRRTGRPALELRVPFFRPLWRRVVTVAVIAGWTGVELAWGSPWWALLTGGIGAYAAWVFFVDFEAGSDDDGYGGGRD